MIRLAVLVAVGAVASATPRRHHPLAWFAASGVIHPILGVAVVGCRLTFAAVTRRRLRRRRQALIAEELPLLGDLVSLGLTGGMSMTSALAAAAPQLHSPLAAEIEAIVRRSRQHGAAMVLEGCSGAAHRLYQLAGRAVATGAPLAGAVDAFTDEVRAEQRSAAIDRAKRLPVLLMFPLALLILPGFVLLTVAPAVAGAFERVMP